MTYSRFLLAASLLLVTAGAARAQVVDSTQTKPELNALPPDRPSLDPTPQPAPTPVSPAPATPPTAPGTFTPARPPQPTAVPAPAQRPVPANAGTVKPEAPTAKAGLMQPDKWFITGNPDIGFSSSNGFSYFTLGLSAMLGYRITDRLAVGPGLTYQYSSLGNLSYSNVGGRVFGQVLFTENLFAHLEHEVLRAEVPVVDIIGNTAFLSTYRTTVNSTFGGLGYRQHLGSRTAFDILVLYNFSHDTNYFLYGQPEFRFNILVDLF